MITDTVLVSKEHRTGGMWTHRGRLRVIFKQPNGTLQTVTLPDDFLALQARVSALEAAAVPNSLEDLTYAG
ncbi:MAG TPA: hypothetical protein VFB50_14330 [Chloroflexota bacterium]|nr:hypothetical protein [Chloroflexota bacterium]